ncbi:MAG TPA: aminotransferase class I/II-fold pyridoxal phosphate-dependent enzyme [Acidimicrobiales bacterium]|nr:aminotransferase class I/II-fold pyridoxal phosphate-dependent enzyme [Acidimicrobiales bacterium]
MTATPTGGWVPPTYPYERLAPARRKAEALPGGAVDLSIGTPVDPPPASVLAALADADAGGATRGYPPSVGTAALREAVAAWLAATFGVTAVPTDAIGACIGTKELVATTPQWLRLRDPSRDTVLYPAVSYPTYAMGAELAGLRAVPVPLDGRRRLDLAAVDPADAERALLLWVNSPGNPAGGLDDLGAAAAWGRRHGVPVFSDECYVELTWDGPPRTILAAGLEGVVAVHSLSKRSNLAGLRVGWYAGDPELVGYLREVRKHVGMMVPGPAQRAAVAALADTAHAAAQRERYRRRLDLLAGALRGIGVPVELPGGGFYLWVPAPGGDAWAWTEELAGAAGVIASPGDFYGPAGAGRVRFAMVAPDDRLALVAGRLARLAG